AGLLQRGAEGFRGPIGFEEREEDAAFHRGQAIGFVVLHVRVVSGKSGGQGLHGGGARGGERFLQRGEEGAVFWRGGGRAEQAEGFERGKGIGGAVPGDPGALKVGVGGDGFGDRCTDRKS